MSFGSTKAFNVTNVYTCGSLHKNLTPRSSTMRWSKMRWLMDEDGRLSCVTYFFLKSCLQNKDKVEQ